MTVCGKDLLVICGPTASGKSALALMLAEKLGGVIINADSGQLYRELQILTARPDKHTIESVPHRLYGTQSVRYPSSAGSWQRQARVHIDQAHRLGLWPMLVGGCGLYLRALLEGLATIPCIPWRIRLAARMLYQSRGLKGLRTALAPYDPVSARTLGDPVRLMRAWEVMAATGRTISSWQQDPIKVSRPAAQVLIILLQPVRNELYAACDRRFKIMVERGAIEEVRALDKLDLPEQSPAHKLLGVRALQDYLRGELTLDTAIAAGQQATRNYAKRQTTWFSHQLPGCADSGYTDGHRLLVFHRFASKEVAESIGSILCLPEARPIYHQQDDFAAPQQPRHLGDETIGLRQPELENLHD